MSKTFFRRNTDVFQGKMTLHSAKRPVVRVHWQFSDTPYISRMIHEGTEEAYLCSLLQNYDLVKAAWYELIRKNRYSQMQK